MPEEVLQSGRIYLLDAGTPIPYPGRKGAIVQEVLGIGEARRILEKGFISAVESGEVAEILSKILGISVPVRFEKINLEPGDEAMIFVPNSRSSGVPGFFIRLRLRKASADKDSQEGRSERRMQAALN
jgi:hypothetical protein